MIVHLTERVSRDAKGQAVKIFFVPGGQTRRLIDWLWFRVKLDV